MWSAVQQLWHAKHQYPLPAPLPPQHIEMYLGSFTAWTAFYAEVCSVRYHGFVCTSAIFQADGSNCWPASAGRQSVVHFVTFTILKKLTMYTSSVSSRNSSLTISEGAWIIFEFHMKKTENKIKYHIMVAIFSISKKNNKNWIPRFSESELGIIHRRFSNYYLVLSPLLHHPPTSHM